MISVFLLNSFISCPYHSFLFFIFPNACAFLLWATSPPGTQMGLVAKGFFLFFLLFAGHPNDNWWLRAFLFPAMPASLFNYFRQCPLFLLKLFSSGMPFFFGDCPLMFFFLRFQFLLFSAPFEATRSIAIGGKGLFFTFAFLSCRPCKPG